MKSLLAAAIALTLGSAAGATTVINANAVLTSGNATLSSVTVGGKVMVGGDFSANGGSNVGGNLNGSANGSTVVGVAGNMNYVNSTVSYGNIVYGGTNNSDAYNRATTPNGTTTQGTVNVAGDFAQAVQVSNYLAAQSTTGSFSTLYEVGTLTAGNSGANVYTMSVSQLSGIYKLVVNGGTSAIINVTGGGTYTRGLSFETNGIAASNILFNFVDATNITFSGTNLPATILATSSAVNAQGTTQGSIIAGTLTGGGATIQGNGYSGSLMGFGAISAVPEPNSWALLIAGFGLVGAMIRRNRRTLAAIFR